MASIYALCDAAGEVRYIGKANNPTDRLKRHMREARLGRRNYPLYAWLRKHGQPELRILEAACPDWKEAEIRLIAAHKPSGKLLNVAAGGDEPSCSTEVRRANAHALNAALKDNPLRARLRRLKIDLANSRKRGYMSDDLRDKLRRWAKERPKLCGEYADIPGATFRDGKWVEHVNRCI